VAKYKLDSATKTGCSASITVYYTASSQEFFEVDVRQQWYTTVHTNRTSKTQYKNQHNNSW